MQIRAKLLGLGAGVLLTLAACAPIPAVIDTPKDGDRVALAVKQPMQVRWANESPAHGSWVLEKAPAAAVTAVGRKTEQPPGGAMALDVFDFEGAQQGTEDLTFAYRRKDGAPPKPEERITISVSVS
jgi:predicted secreted protein